MKSTKKTRSLISHGSSSVSTQPISNTTFEVLDGDNNDGDDDTSFQGASCRGGGSLLSDWAIILSPDDEQHLRPHRSELHNNHDIERKEEEQASKVFPMKEVKSSLAPVEQKYQEETPVKQIEQTERDDGDDVDNICQLNKRLENLVIEDLFLDELLKKTEAKTQTTKENDNEVFAKGVDSINPSTMTSNTILFNSTNSTEKGMPTETRPRDDIISMIVSSTSSTIATKRKRKKSRAIQGLVRKSKTAKRGIDSQPIVLATFS